MSHTFVISAYKESPYLEDCIKSLKEQSVKSHIIMTTSTPNLYIENLAKKYGLDLYINPEQKGIGSDWNFAYNKVKEGLVTIAHQDDIYHRDYVKTLLCAKKAYPDMSLFFCASKTIKNGCIKEWGNIEIIKKILRMPLRLWCLNHISYVKRCSILFGNPIICPSIAYDKKLCGADIFSKEYQFILDWDTLYHLSNKKGRWISYEKALIYYRVHDGAATKQCILDNKRTLEENMMFDRLWKPPFSDILKFFYKKAASNYMD